MKTLNKVFLAIFLTFLGCSVHADVDFTQQDIELVKGACLAGDSFEFTTEADGSISVINLEGKGRLQVTKKNVVTVDLPESDKTQEFTEIRSCIKDYLSMSMDQGNRVNQSGDNNENNQTNRRGGQSNEAIQSGSGNKSSQSNE